MWRRALNLIAVVAFVGSLGLAILWARSLREWDKLVLRWPAHGTGIASASGMIVVNVKLTRNASELPETGWSSSAPTVWTSSDGQTMLGDDDPLPIAAQIFRSEQRFAWERVIGDAPGQSWWRDGTPGFYGPGARPVLGDRYLRIRVPHWALLAALLVISVPRLAVLVFRWLVRRRRTARDDAPNAGMP